MARLPAHPLEFVSCPRPHLVPAKDEGRWRLGSTETLTLTGLPSRTAQTRFTPGDQATEGAICQEQLLPQEDLPLKKLTADLYFILESLSIHYTTEQSKHG